MNANTFTRRVYPAVSPAYQTRISNGRQYSGLPGTFQDVPVDDSEGLENWAIGPLSGPTSSRPQNIAGGFQIQLGQIYVDTTLSVTAIWDGANWRSVLTAALV